MNVDLNKILSKRSGVMAITIWFIASLAGNGTWWGLAGMGLISVLVWRYMDLDHQKEKWRIEAGLEGPQKTQKETEHET